MADRIDWRARSWFLKRIYLKSGKAFYSLESKNALKDFDLIGFRFNTSFHIDCLADVEMAGMCTRRKKIEWARRFKWTKIAPHNPSRRLASYNRFRCKICRCVFNRRWWRSCFRSLRKLLASKITRTFAPRKIKNVRDWRCFCTGIS